MSPSLSVSPSEGQGLTTIFKLTAKKPSNTKATCSFGYINDLFGGVYVELQPSNTNNLTISDEIFETQLPASLNGDTNSYLKVYAKCQD